MVMVIPVMMILVVVGAVEWKAREMVMVMAMEKVIGKEVFCLQYKDVEITAGMWCIPSLGK